MIYGLSGVHRCGKTYLAEALAYEYNMVFQPSVIRASFEEHGLFPDQILTWEQRIGVQNTALRNMHRVLDHAEARTCDTIFDRTTIDLIGYTMTTVVENGDHEHEVFVQYMNDARALLDRFDRIVVLQSHADLKPKDEPYKGRKDAQHMRLLENTMTSMGIMYGMPVLPYTVDLKDRARYVAELLGLDRP